MFLVLFNVLLLCFKHQGMKSFREKLLADILEGKLFSDLFNKVLFQSFLTLLSCFFLIFFIAFVAALYVDKGLRYVETFCYVCLFPRLEVNKLSSLVLLESHFGSGLPTTSTLKMRSIALSGI